MKNNWDAFKVVLSLLIYGITRFLNIDNFIDMRDICIFLTKNLAPTLLADIYYYLTFRHEKKERTILCCALLLDKGFLSHLPKKGAFIENKDNFKCLQRVMSLTARDIFWYSREYDGIKIIFSCCSFPNVPLIGTRGYINYNFVLALWKKVRRAWDKIHRKGKELGKKNFITKELYT